MSAESLSALDFKDAVHNAFAAPTQDLGRVFELVFDVASKQQLVIAALREDLTRVLEDELPRMKHAFDDQLEALRTDVANANAAAASAANTANAAAALAAKPVVAPPPPGPRAAILVGNVSPDAVHEVVSALPEDCQATAATAAVRSNAGWAASYQVVHVATVREAELAVAALDGAGVATAATVDRPRRASASMVVYDGPGGAARVEPAHERSVLVSHGAGREAQLLKLVGAELGANVASDAGRLGEYGFSVLEFPTVLEAIAAVSCLDGAEVPLDGAEPSGEGAADDGSDTDSDDGGPAGGTTDTSSGTVVLRAARRSSAGHVSQLRDDLESLKPQTGLDAALVLSCLSAEANVDDLRAATFTSRRRLRRRTGGRFPRAASSSRARKRPAPLLRRCPACASAAGASPARASTSPPLKSWRPKWICWNGLYSDKWMQSEGTSLASRRKSTSRSPPWKRASRPTTPPRTGPSRGASTTWKAVWLWPT